MRIGLRSLAVSLALASIGCSSSPEGGAASPVTASSRGWLGVSGTRFVDAHGDEVLLRGFGIGELYNMESYFLRTPGPDVGGMGETKFRDGVTAALGPSASSFFETWESNVVRDEDLARMAGWGVNSIRLPLNYHMLSPSPGSYLESGFGKVDRFIRMAKAHGIWVILDLHAAPGAQNCEQMSDSPDGIAHLWREPETYRQWTIDLWRTLAARYADEPAVAGYDIFDEPYDTESTGTFSTGMGTLRRMYLDVTAAIRSVDARHVLFFEGANWSSDDGSTHGFAGLEPAWDDAMAWSFHKYWDANTLAAIEPYLDLRERTGRPVWNGETGEDDRPGWSGQMIALLEAHDIGWNEWTFKKAAPEDTNPYAIPLPAGWGPVAQFLAHGGAPPAGASEVLTILAANASTPSCQANDAWIQELLGASAKP